MRRILMCLMCLLLAIMIFDSDVNANEAIDRGEFEEDTILINNFGFMYTKIGDSLMLRDGSLGVFTDEIVLYSNIGFFLGIYDLVYADSFTMLSEPRQDTDSKLIYIKYNVPEERKLRFNRLIQDGYITEEEIKKYPITKQTLATILYRIYKDIIPFKKSVAYSDTDDEAIRWAAEKGLPNFLNKSGFNINPNKSLQSFSPDYMTTLYYVSLYFPNPITNEYGELSDKYYEDEVLSYRDFTMKKSIAENYIEEIRQEIMKPRLGYWKRDVMNNEDIFDLVKLYTKTNTEKTLKKIHQYLKKKYNLYSYQDDIGYIRYMFSEYNH